MLNQAQAGLFPQGSSLAVLASDYPDEGSSDTDDDKPFSQQHAKLVGQIHAAQHGYASGEDPMEDDYSGSEEDSSDDSCSASNNTVSPDVYIPPKKSSKWSVTSPESVSQPLRVSEFNLRPRRGSLSYEGMM